ncbi:MAG: hypothetical protein ABIP41_07450 [Croceibacterium sp.]
MSITSHAFGRVKLTEADATKFKNQVTYGRPKAAAKASVEEGMKLSKSLGDDGAIKLLLKQPA